jgi:membrane protease YdiL (CAAX protease family)
VAQDRFSPLEFIVVIGVAFGSSILYSVDDLIAGRTMLDATRATFGESDTYAVVLYELLAAPFLAAILYVGGWRWKDFPLGATLGATLLGAVSAAGVYLADWMLTEILKALFPALRSIFAAWDEYRPSDPASLGAIVLLSIVNPVFEEVIVCGYVITALRKRFGDTAAANVSVVIRASYHLYQGLAMLPFHLAYGLLQAYTYLRLGRLWPLIVSHAILDFVAMLYLV